MQARPSPPTSPGPDVKGAAARRSPERRVKWGRLILGVALLTWAVALGAVGYFLQQVQLP